MFNGLGLSADLIDKGSLALVIQSLDRFLGCHPVDGHHFFRAFKLRLTDGPHIPEANYLGDFSCVVTNPTRMAFDLDIETCLFPDFPDCAL
jgi:hypothetical protein